MGLSSESYIVRLSMIPEFEKARVPTRAQVIVSQALNEVNSLIPRLMERATLVQFDSQSGIACLSVPGFLDWRSIQVAFDTVAFANPAELYDYRRIATVDDQVDSIYGRMPGTPVHTRTPPRRPIVH